MRIRKRKKCMFIQGKKPVYLCYTLPEDHKKLIETESNIQIAVNRNKYQTHNRISINSHRKIARMGNLKQIAMDWNMLLLCVEMFNIAYVRTIRTACTKAVIAITAAVPTLQFGFVSESS